MWKCPDCGEQIDKQFDSCWKCAEVDANAAERELIQKNKSSIRLVWEAWCSWDIHFKILVLVTIFTSLSTFDAMDVQRPTLDTLFKVIGGIMLYNFFCVILFGHKLLRKTTPSSSSGDQ